MSKLGIYFHIPFCSGRCGYCNFVSGTDFSFMPQYHKRILESIVAHGKCHGDMIHDTLIDSIYFGGGTPSVYFAGGIPDILKAVRDNFNVAKNCEITAEANPESLTKDKAREWKECGVNRVSIGLQTLDAELLSVIGRRHNADDFFNAVNNAAGAGIQNISADVMLGLPRQTITNVADTINALCELPQIKHISAYALKLEPGTPMYNKITNYKLQITNKDNNNYPLNDDIAADMYDAAYELLKQKGFPRYEVSNFARAGYECRHNLKYWNLDEYLGIGVAAHSYYGGKRYAETNDIKEYLAGKKPFCTTLDGNDIKTEYVMLKLRLESGIDTADYYAKFGTRIEERAGAEFLLKHNLIGISNGRLYILPDKFYVMNSIVLKLLE